MRMTGVLASILLVVLMTPSAAHAEERETLYAVGDSITMGAGLDDMFSERYPARLRNHGYRIRVSAEGGRCLVAVCWGMAPLVQTFRDEVLRQSPRPDRVVLAIGTNDLAHVTDAQLRKGYRLLRQQGKRAGVVVHVATIIPSAIDLAMYPREWVEPQRLRINRWIRHTWPDTYIDFAAALEGDDGAMRPEFNMGDGLHPNALGAQALALAVRAKLMPGGYLIATHE